jgi:hypothetical protein
MKRNTLIAVALCLMMMATVGASADSDKQDENPRQAGKSSIYFYDVESQNPDDTGYGRLVINTDKETFVFIGKDFTPNRLFEIKVDTESEFHLIATGHSNKSGNILIQGEWEGTLPEQGTVGISYCYPPAYGFILVNNGGYVARMKIAYSTDNGATWKLTDKQISGISLGESHKVDIDDLLEEDIPEGSSLVKMKMIVVGGGDVTTSEIYSYVHSSPPGYCYPYYISHGPTWNAWLEEIHIECTPYIGSNYWTIYPE